MPEEFINKYFIRLIPIDKESEEILKPKEYKNNKSVVQMWEESLKEEKK